MGCLKKFAKMIIFLTLLFAFFAYGGYTFVKEKYDNYTNPGREILVEEEKDFGSLEKISADYALTRSINLFGYRKINALYLPNKQKITIIDLNSKEILTKEDFESDIIKTKLEEISSHFINAPIIPLSDVQVVRKGKIKSLNGVVVPYVDFKAHLKFVPIVGINGTVALYTTKNSPTVVNKIKSKIQKNEGVTAKLIVSAKFPTGYKETAVRKFISQLGI